MFRSEAGIQVPPRQHGRRVGRLSKWLPLGLSRDQAFTQWELHVFGGSSKATGTASFQHPPQGKPAILRDFRILRKSKHKTGPNFPHRYRKKMFRHSLKFYTSLRKKKKSTWTCSLITLNKKGQTLPIPWSYSWPLRAKKQGGQFKGGKYN